LQFGHAAEAIAGRKIPWAKLTDVPRVLEQILEDTPDAASQSATALADESALLAEGGAKADERYMSRVAHLAPPPKPPIEESKA